MWRALTLYMWANSIAKGVSRERGGGFTVTEMTLEFRTVVFLGSQQAGQGAGTPSVRPAAPPWTPATPTSSVGLPTPLLPMDPSVPTSEGPGSCPGSDRARCPPQTRTSHGPLEDSVPATLVPILPEAGTRGGPGSVAVPTPHGCRAAVKKLG